MPVIMAKAQLQTHYLRISHRTLERLSADVGQSAKNKQQCGRLSQCNTKLTNMHPSIWKLKHLLMKEEIVAKKGKNEMLKKKMNQ